MGEEEIAIVEKYKYLGCIVRTSKVRSDGEIDGY